jgi:hypothetical protein
MADVDLIFGAKGAEEVLTAAAKIRGAGKNTRAEFDDLNRSAAAAFRATQTEAEKLAAQIVKVEQAIEKGQLGKLSVDEATKALDRMKQKLMQVTSAADDAADAMKLDDAKTQWKAIDQLAREFPDHVISAKDEVLDLGKETGKLKQANAGAFGDLRQIAGYAGGVGMAYAAVSKLKSILADVRAENERLASQARESIEGEGGLAQLAGSQKEYDALLQESRGYFAMGAGSSRDESAKLLFDLQSAGLSKEDRALFAEAKAKGVVGDAGQLAGGVSAMRASGSSSSTTDLVDKILAAGALSPGSAAEVARAAGKAGVGAQRAGVGEDELLASVAVLGKSVGSPEQGGTLARSLFKSLDKAAGPADTKEEQAKVAAAEKRLAEAKTQAADAEKNLAELKDSPAERRALDAKAALAAAEGKTLGANATPEQQAAREQNIERKRLLAERADTDLKRERIDREKAVSDARAGITDADSGLAGARDALGRKQSAGGLQKGSLASMLEQIKKREAAGESARDILGGDQEAVSAYGVLTGGGAGDFASLTQGIAAADKQDLFAQRLGLIDSSRDAAINSKKTQQGSDVSEQGLERGADQNDWEAMQAENRKNNPIWGRIKNATQDTAWFMGMDENTILNAHTNTSPALKNRRGREPLTSFEMASHTINNPELMEFANKQFGEGGLTADELDRARGMYEVAKQALEEQKKTNAALEKISTSGGGLRAGSG